MIDSMEPKKEVDMDSLMQGVNPNSLYGLNESQLVNISSPKSEIKCGSSTPLNQSLRISTHLHPEEI